MSFIYWPRHYFYPGFKLHSESFFIIIAFGFFVYWAIKEMSREKTGLSSWDSFWLFFSAIFGSLAGGRLWHFISYWEGPNTIADIFNLNKPGLTSFGMILGGTISVVIFVYFLNKKKKFVKDWRILFGRYADILAAATALFVFVYRMGCFHYGCVPGIETRLPWGMFALHYAKFSGMIMHPTALYLSFSALIIFIFLHWYKDKKRFEGEIGLLFLMIYSFNRFWIEFFRNGMQKYFWLSEVQWILLQAFIVFLLLYLYVGKEKHHLRPERKDE